MQHTMQQSRVLLLAGLGLAAVAALGGCRGERTSTPPRQFFPDMDDSPKNKPQTQSKFFADGRAMRQPVAGTVAFGGSATLPGQFDGDKPSPEARPESMDMTRDLLAADRTRLLKDDSAPGMTGFYTGVLPTGEYLDSVPSAIKVDREFITRGQTKFNIYCSVCHGYDGKGKGTVGQAWSYGLPNFYDTKYQDSKEKTGKDGYLFTVVRNGVIGPDGSSKMPGYAHAINERDAWAVVTYLRALQASEKGTMSDVPDAMKPTMSEQMRTGAAKPAAKPAGSPAPAAPSTTPAPAPASPAKPEVNK